MQVGWREGTFLGHPSAHLGLGQAILVAVNTPTAYRPDCVVAANLRWAPRA